jgi:3-deoxy-D-manno-octulosonic-acid transferase
MPYLLNLLYLLALVILSPWLFWKTLTTDKYRRGIWAKLTGRAVLRAGERPCIWFHGVSVGEVHLLRQVISAFRQHYPDWECVVSTTTDTGFAEARKHFADLTVFHWPLDFTGRSGGRCGACGRISSCWPRARCGRTSSRRRSGAASRSRSSTRA